ncbi:Retrovirus-related Pol polyprotein from transposon TNT 1-94 [Senna tora]|uniref:Retrovirus-related Pol polyprotein from transposon TNT 1-94 n=1 Tax=Senna tora TaxID=362788 RepID=A0A834XKF6_9FABA|nr:Retrovirus-related Pol polyprotein from transposon TNT 1-94 [Senna tora]
MIINNNNNPLFLLLLLHFILFSSISQRPSIVVEARPLSFKSHTGQSGNLALLGVVCKCCDGVDGACTSTWTQSCSNLQCSPWKYQTRPS